MNRSALDRLCALAGIAPEYSDVWGKIHRASGATRVALLQAISTKGGTYFPTSDTDTSNGDQSYKYIIGDVATRKAKLETAFRKMTESVTTPSLIE